MNHMQLQSLFDSVCRCFGHPENGSAANNGGMDRYSTNDPRNQNSGYVSGSPSQGMDAASQSSARRRTSRLELKDKKWDELFEKKRQRSSKSSSRGTPGSSQDHPEELHAAAQAVAQAKQAANPPRYSRSKRKRPEKAREEIFRSKVNFTQPTGCGVAGDSSAGMASTPFSRLLHPSLAMCFATPIRGTEDDVPDETDMRSVDNSETATLNTCEDTISSTVYFDNKWSHLQETRPPMPLFNQFKIGLDKDGLRNIMATDSHSSWRLVRLLQQQQQREQVPLEESSNDSNPEDRRKRRSKNQRRERGDSEMEDAIPEIKAVSHSSDSSRSNQAQV